jgi:cell wall-associated NlpC family hydrolase
MGRILKAAASLVTALRQRNELGDRYVYGALGPNGWDCSGLTMKAWKAAGVKLPHAAGSSTAWAKGSPSPS